MKALELKVPPVACAILFAAAMWGAARSLPRLDIPLAEPWARIAVGVLAAAGALVVVAGVVGLLSRRTTLNPINPGGASSLVSSGVYGISRNPMYLGLALWLAAWAVALANAGAMLLAAGFVAYLTRFQIVPEERGLREKFGDAFLEYVARVPRWI